jgi:hypothetical protein
MNITLMMSIGFTVLVGGIVIWMFRSRMNTLNNKLATLFNFVQNETQRTQQIQEPSTKIIVSSDSDSEEDDTTDDESDDESDDGNVEHSLDADNLKEVEVSIDELKKIEDIEKETEGHDEEDHEGHDEEDDDTMKQFELSEKIVTIERNSPSFPEDWRKLNLADLKALATQFSICENPSKYKKKELQEIVSSWNHDKSEQPSNSTVDSNAGTTDEYDDHDDGDTNDDEGETSSKRTMDLTDVEM